MSLHVVAVAPESLIAPETPAAIWFTGKHPKTDAPQTYIFKEGEGIYEVKRFSDIIDRSWFISDTVMKDGSLHLITRIDPLFLAIPLFLRSSAAKDEKGGNGVFMSVDQVISVHASPSSAYLMQSPGFEQQLRHICEIKEIDNNNTVFRLDNEKIIVWLKKKVDVIVCELEKDNSINVSKGSVSAKYTNTSKNSQITKYDYLNYAVGLVSEYLPENMAILLHSSYPELVVAAVDEIKEEEIDPKQYSEVSDYSSQKPKKEAVDKKKQTTAQKQLAAVNIKGMTPISQLFAKKK